MVGGCADGGTARVYWLCFGAWTASPRQMSDVCASYIARTARWIGALRGGSGSMACAGWGIGCEGHVLTVLVGFAIACYYAGITV